MGSGTYASMKWGQAPTPHERGQAPPSPRKGSGTTAPKNGQMHSMISPTVISGSAMPLKIIFIR